MFNHTIKNSNNINKLEDNYLRQIFRGYYRPTDEEFSKLWKNCIFIPDANVLLNIYRYTPTTCDTLLNIFTEISERLWVTHQAASEYHHKRLDVIGEQESAYENIKEKLRNLQKNNENQLNSFARHPFINVKIFSEEIKSTLTEIENELDECKKKHPNLLDTDELRDNITALFEGKVGKSYSPEKLKELYDIGKKRYEYQIPPGFLDKDKDNEKQFGDLILWFQIIDYAKSIKKPIIFITDDIKEDWWLKFKGKTIGPRPELIDEIYRDAGVDFYMYQTEQFMACAEKFLKREVDKEAIKEVQEIKQHDEEYKELLLNQIKKDELRYLEERTEKYDDLIKWRDLGKGRDFEKWRNFEEWIDLRKGRNFEEWIDLRKGRDLGKGRDFEERTEKYDDLIKCRSLENIRDLAETYEKLKQVKKNQDESDEKPNQEND